ncbi:MAG: lipid A export permease/ATP-binding protein MsbA [Desulfovibrio sp.]|nr:MAG: lipid A export permease/ATP-binding protein MsbA [Desulfovibrio sp.]
MLKRIFSYFKPYKVRVVIGVVSMGIVALATAALAYLVKPAIDEIFINQDREALITVPALIVGVFLIKGIFQYLQNYLMKYSGLRVLEDMRNALYSKMVCLPVKFFEENQVGMLMSRIINDVMMIRVSLPALVMVIRQILTMAGLIGIVFYHDWYLAIWSILVLPLAIYPFYVFARKLRKYSRRNQSKIADIATFLQEIFSGVRVVKAFATEDEEYGRFKEENSRLVRIAVKQVIVSELSSRVMELVGVIGVSLVIWFGGNKVIDGDMSAGAFFSFLTSLFLLYEPIKKLNSANSDFQNALAGAERVFEVVDSKDVVEEADGDVALTPPFTGLAFEGVTFGYEDNGAPALSDLDLAVSRGDRIAIVGPSGSGKTTLVNMVPRFYVPQSGRIVLNGRNLNDFTLATLRRSIGMVSQEAFLFNATVADNIAYGQDSVDMAAVEQAARTAFAHDFVCELPDGYDTVIGERGVKLSGGQKQRLTIARALLKNPPLLILDEATSALDTESERIVQLALENLMQDRTSIVIAHRLSTVLGSDRIVVMDKGRIVDQGPHGELLTRCDLYAKLYTMQFSDNNHVVAKDSQAGEEA